MNPPFLLRSFRLRLVAGAVGAVAGLSLAAPRVAAREMHTDRPDATESPFTVEAGRFQFELDAGAFTRDRLDGVRTTEWNVMPFNVRYGLASDLEAGFFFAPHIRTTEQVGGAPETKRQGVGDTIVRTKLNLAGNDSGGPAFGVMADLKVPTAADGLGNDRVEGAIRFPVAFGLGGGWEGGAMTSLEWVHTGSRRRMLWANTLTFAREITTALGGFLELTSSTGDGAHVATLNGGLTRRLSPDLQLDAGVYLGLSRQAPDLTIFAGLARRY